MVSISNALVCAFNVSAATELQQRWANRKIITPSVLQQDVIYEVEFGAENIIVGAVAGSGKTSLLMAVLASLEKANPAFEPTILNIHKIATSSGGSLLYKTIGKHGRIDPDRYKKILGINEEGEKFYEFYESLCTYKEEQIPTYSDLRYTVCKMIDLCRLELTNFRDVEAVAELAMRHKFDIVGIENEVSKFVSRIITLGTQEMYSRNLKTNLKSPDFTDLLFIPVDHAMTYGSFDHDFKFDLVIVDECQDLSRCQLELIKLCSHESTRFLAVGDRRQAIYGFAGANCNSFDEIKDTLNCEYMPLSVNYRCPQSVISLAQRWCKEITACDFAPVGEIKEMKIEEVPKNVQPGEMVLCRWTSPLISCAIKCIQLKKPAKVKGRDIGKQLCNVIEAVSQIKGFRYEEFKTFSSKYFGAKIAKLNTIPDSETRIDMLADQQEAIEVCWQEFVEAKSVLDLQECIYDIFSDNASTILCQTIHRAKGSECNVVYILDYQRMLSINSKLTEEQKEQEANLAYVAVTRCKFTSTNDGQLFLC